MTTPTPKPVNSQSLAWAARITTDSLAGKPLPAELQGEVAPEGVAAKIVQNDLTATRLGHLVRVALMGGFSPNDPKIGGE